MLEQAEYSVTEHVKLFLSSWYLRVGWNANVEDVFAQLQDVLKRRSKPDCGSLPNLQAVTIRSVMKKPVDVDNAKLPSPDAIGAADDWEGRAARGVKSSF